MNSNYLMIDIDDPRSSLIAEAFSNKTAKRMLSLLANQELSQTELVQQLKVPASTIDYNIKKLVSAGLVEEARSFWSSKGKKVPSYRVSDRKILISPKKMIRGTIPAVIASVALAGLIKVYTASSAVVAPSLKVAQESSGAIASSSQVIDSPIDLYGPLAQASNVWAWFLLGSLIALAVVLLWNWGKK